MILEILQVDSGVSLKEKKEVNCGCLKKELLIILGVGEQEFEDQEHNKDLGCVHEGPP